MMQGWVLEQCCAGLADLLDDVSLSEPVDLPVPPGMQANEMYDRFAQLVEFAYTGQAEAPRAALAATWALACCFDFEALKVCRAQCRFRS
jgi:hypothetical protein